MRKTSCHDRPLLFCLILCVTVTFVVPPASLGREAGVTPSPNQASTATLYDISPSSGVQGKEYDVLVTSNECLKNSTKNSLQNLQLVAPAGSGITVTNSKSHGCRLTAHLVIAGDAPIAIVKLQLVHDEVLKTIIDFAITSFARGPIPPGLNNQGEVDVMWSVVPDKITSDNFGGKVKRQFYCIEVVIGNNSGYDLQLSSIGFTLPGLQNGKQRIPSSGYRTVRGSLEAFQLVSPRNFVINGLKVLGPVMTGFLPFFHATNRVINFSEAINIISNPLEKGVEAFWPDTTTRKLDRLADMTFRDDVSTKTIVPNNVQARIVTFVPKELVFPYKQRFKISKDAFLNPKNPQDVMRALGNIVIVGEQIEHVNRVRVVASGLELRPTDTSISGKIVDACGNGVEGVTMVLSGGTDFTARQVTTSPDGGYEFPNVPTGRIYTVTPEAQNLTFHAESPGTETFLLNDAKTDLDFGADYAVLVITGKVIDENSDAVKDVSVELEPIDALTPKTLAQKKTTNESGVFRFEIPGSKIKILTARFSVTPKLDQRQFSPKSLTWSCDQRNLEFTLKPEN